MGIIYSHNNFELNDESDTLSFNIDILENDTSRLFYKIISNIENLFNVRINIELLDKKKKGDIHMHFEINNCLLEIKLSKKEKIYSLGYTKTRLKIFTQKYDTINKKNFHKLCSFDYFE
jgi:hypothetical protein